MINETNISTKNVISPGGCSPDKDEFMCSGSTCIAAARLCNNENDCGDYGDEFNCKLRSCYSDEKLRIKNSFRIRSTYSKVSLKKIAPN